MSRVFRRGELKAALLHVLAATGPANGYTIMQHLAERVGGGWRASPGAIYPALLALEDAGRIAGHDDGGSRLYSLTDAGRRALDERPDLLENVASRASHRVPATTLGRLLDAFAAEVPARTRVLDPAEQQDVAAALATARHRITSVLDQGAHQ